ARTVVSDLGWRGRCGPVAHAKWAAHRPAPQEAASRCGLLRRGSSRDATRSARADAGNDGALNRRAALVPNRNLLFRCALRASRPPNATSTFAVMVTTGTFHCCAGYGVLLRSPFLLHSGYCPSAVVALPFARRGHCRRLSNRFFESIRATFDHSQDNAPQQAHQ